MDLRQVDAEYRIKCFARGEMRRIGLLGLVPGSGQRFRRCRAGRPQLLQNQLDPPVARRHFFLVDVVQLQGLRQRKDVLFPIVANESLTDGLSRPFGKWLSRKPASVAALRSPATIARTMRIPVTPVMSETT